MKMPVQVQDIIPADAAQEEEEEAPPQEVPPLEVPPAPKRRGRPPGSKNKPKPPAGEVRDIEEAPRPKPKPKAKPPRAHEARRQQESGDTGGVGERGFRGRTSSKPGRAEKGAVGPVSARSSGSPPSEDRALHQSAGQGARLLTNLVATVKEQ